MKRNKNIRTVLFVLFLAGLFFQSCLRDFELQMPEVERQIAVNCFFTPDSSWKAQVYFTHHIDSSGDNAVIVNALVSVEDETGNIVFLNHTRDGIYHSEEKPAAGAHYRLKVEVKGYQTVTAESYVPLKSDLSNWQLLSQNKIRFRITPQLTDEYFIAVRGRYFDTVKGYNIYCINPEVFEHLKENKQLTDEVITHLKPLEGQTLYSYNVVQKVQELMTPEEIFNYWYFVQTTFEEYAVCGKLKYRPQSKMILSGCSSEQAIFYQAPNDLTTLLMNQTGTQDAEISMALNSEHFPDWEFFLEYMDLSSDYYYFLKDFLLQVSNREEINAPPVIVYSNIENGVGIFAGYRSQLINLSELN